MLGRRAIQFKGIVVGARRWTARLTLPGCPLSHLQKPTAVGVIRENGFPSISAVHHVIKCAGILQTQFARHIATISLTAAPVNPIDRLLHDPFTVRKESVKSHLRNPR